MQNIMTESEFSRIYLFLKNKYGIDMSKKKEIMIGRLENYLVNNGFGSYNEYMNVIEADITGKWERELVDMLSTNHTFFMREFEHFEFLKKIVLPELKEKEKYSKDLNIWCGAASTGQEPYMIAMLLKEYFGLEHHEWDTKVLATDVSTQALEQAIEGIYDAEQIEVLPETWKRRFIKAIPGEKGYAVTQEIREQVIFRSFNLMDVFPFKRKMHIVFLRNVMFYFDKETKARLIKKVYDVMEPGGYLFIGRTETIDRDKAPFELIQPSIFRK